jgi:hypothetical protein
MLETALYFEKHFFYKQVLGFVNSFIMKFCKNHWSLFRTKDFQALREASNPSKKNIHLSKHEK